MRLCSDWRRARIGARRGIDAVEGQFELPDRILVERVADFAARDVARDEVANTRLFVGAEALAGERREAKAAWSRAHRHEAQRPQLEEHRHELLEVLHVISEPAQPEHAKVGRDRRRLARRRREHDRRQIAARDAPAASLAIRR